MSCDSVYSRSLVAWKISKAPKFCDVTFSETSQYNYYRCWAWPSIASQTVSRGWWTVWPARLGAAVRKSKCSQSQCSWEIMAAFKRTDELVDELIMFYEKRISCISWWNVPSLSHWRIHSLVHKRLFRRLLCLLFIWIAMSRAQAAAISSIPSSVRAQFVI